MKPTSSSASDNDVNLETIKREYIYANENEREKKFIHKKNSSKIPEVVLKSSFVSEQRTHNFFSIWIFFWFNFITNLNFKYNHITFDDDDGNL